MNLRLRVGAWATATGTVLMLAVASAQTQTTAIRAGRLIDPDTGTVAERQTILVVDGLISVAVFTPLLDAETAITFVMKDGTIVVR